MKALSIQQPWAWMILHLPPELRKDVENRDWLKLTSYRGWVQIHASAGGTRGEYEDACAFARKFCKVPYIPAFDQLPRGGIVGMAKIVDHVREHPSPWFIGPTALVLEEAEPWPLQPCKGMLGFFEPEIDPDWRPQGRAYPARRLDNRGEACLQTSAQGAPRWRLRGGNFVKTDEPWQTL